LSVDLLDEWTSKAEFGKNPVSGSLGKYMKCHFLVIIYRIYLFSEAGTEVILFSEAGTEVTLRNCQVK